MTRMIEQFSKLCRMGMRTGGNTIPLSEGLEHAKVYLEVINFRHQDKIELSVSIEPDVRDCYIPQFMLSRSWKMQWSMDLMMQQKDVRLKSL